MRHPAAPQAAGGSPRPRPSDEAEAPAYPLRRRSSNTVIITVVTVLLLAVAGVLVFLLATRSDQEGDTARKKTGEKPAAEEPAQKSTEEEIAWVDASQHGVERGDVRVQVRHAWVGPASGATVAEPESPELLYLFVHVGLVNASEDRKLDYEGWNRAPSARVFDGKNNEYDRKRLPLKAALTKKTPVYPGKSIDDVLVFEPPVEGAGDLFLDLPAAAIGEKGRLHFKIPAAMVGSEPPEGLAMAEPQEPAPRPGPVDPLTGIPVPEPSEPPPFSHPGTSQPPEQGPSPPAPKVPDEPPDIRDLIRDSVEEHGGGDKVEPKGDLDFQDDPKAGKIDPPDAERAEPKDEPRKPNRRKENPFR
jgi:hypothetical protein